MTRYTLRLLGAAVMFAALSFGAQIVNPDAAYTSSTTLLTITVANGTNLTSLTNGALTLTFGQQMRAVTLGAGWATWSSPPDSEINSPGVAPRIVFSTNTSAQTGTIQLSVPVTTFGFELEPDQGGAMNATVEFRLGNVVVESVTRAVNSSAGARLFARTGSPIDNVVITMGATSGFGLAQFRYAGIINARDTPFQARYFANLNQGESYINITNTGANGAPLLGPGFGGAVGNICVNVYAFSPDEQLVSCCSCLVTPNGVVNLGVTRDLTSKTLTGVIPTSLVVKTVATLAGERGSSTTCTNSAATASTAQLVPGMLAWGTTIHNAPAAVPGYRVTETPFSPATLSPGELASITGRCAAILGNGSGFGICRSCQAGALGASHSY